MRKTHHSLHGLLRQSLLRSVVCMILPVCVLAGLLVVLTQRYGADIEKARVAERIKMLQGYVPEMLIQNTTIYGILSKGIHELSEEECRKYFPVVKECIYQILGMWESLRKKQADEAALSKALSAITTSIK